MATQNTRIVSSSMFLQGTTLATGSYAAITGSMLGIQGAQTIVVSGSLYTGSVDLLQPSQGASGALGPITGSMMGVAEYPTLVFGFTTETTGSSGGGGFTLVTYVITGWNAATLSRETWSGPSINTPNPSGQPLVDVTVMGSYPPQNSAT